MEFRGLFLLLVIFSLFGSIVAAHVPYLEFKDYSDEKPFVVRKLVQQSKAAYAWLEHDGVNPCDDIDVYKFNIRNRPLNIYIELIVPVYEDYYEEFVPWFALIGPDLPEPTVDLPFDIPEGYGAIIKNNVEPGEQRDTFYEPFCNKSYYKGPIFEETISVPGIYYVYVWDPYDNGGDYTLVLGKKEIFLLTDLIRALIYTPLIRKNLELHII